MEHSRCRLFENDSKVHDIKSFAYLLKHRINHTGLAAGVCTVRSLGHE